MRTTNGFILLGLALGCNMSPPPGPASSAPGAPPSAAPASSAVAGALHIGEPISEAEVLLADVAKDPAHFSGRPFSTRGVVTAVCQEMGCWMEIKDATTGAHIRMHGHTFFVPRTASGHQARVQATLVASGAPAACNEPECAPKDLSMLQLDATGVELL